MGLDHFNPQYFPGQFQDFSFGQQGSYAPSTFVHHDSGYGSVDNRMGERSPHDVDMQLNPPYHVNTTAPMDSASRLESQLENNEKYGITPLFFLFMDQRSNDRLDFAIMSPCEPPRL